MRSTGSHHPRAGTVAGLSLMALAAASCTAILGINKDYREPDSSTGGGGTGGAGGPSTSASGGGAVSGSSSSGAGGSVTGVGTTCATILAANPQAPNGVYTLDPDGAGGVPPFAAYCEMVADGGGWTLALKIDGTKSTFDYAASLWEDTTTFQANKPDLDLGEAKLATFSHVSFTDVRLGMIDQGTTRWITITLPSSQTLLTLLQGGQPTPTNLGPSVWMTLVANPSLQPYCNAEGFNRFPAKPKNARARIGIVANEQNDCTSSDSVIGFGADDGFGQTGTGNFASLTPSGDRNTKTFGYVMVR